MWRESGQSLVWVTAASSQFRDPVSPSPPSSHCDTGSSHHGCPAPSLPLSTPLVSLHSRLHQATSAPGPPPPAWSSPPCPPTLMHAPSPLAMEDHRPSLLCAGPTHPTAHLVHRSGTIFGGRRTSVFTHSLPQTRASYASLPATLLILCTFL